MRSDIMNRVADKMEEGLGIEAYYQTPSKELLEGEKCQKCGSLDFKHGKDILDVWFDSGVCHASVQRRREGLGFPADIYLEGSDQHRGWFQTSLLSAIASSNQAPYKALITHGFVNDTDGRKMSKSQGNVVDPAKVTDSMGAEILRLWVAYEDYGQDLTCGPQTFQRIVETYRRFRNTMRFLTGNLNGFDPEKECIPFADMPGFDRWAMVKLNELVEKVTQAYENYSYYRVYHLLNHFITVELSATISDVFKDRLYTWKENSKERKSAQTVLFHTMNHLVLMMAPILSFLAEETYEYLPGKRKTSVFLCDFPKPRKEWKDDSLLADFEELFAVRDDVAKELESLRQSKIIGASLEAQVKISCEGVRSLVLKKYENMLDELFIVSKVVLDAGPYSVKAAPADGEKCPRCWVYSTELGSDREFDDVCPKCVRALKC
jgi:isoleucyl-tRNA synthetase